MIKTITKKATPLILSESISKLILFLWASWLAKKIGVDLFGQYIFLISFTLLFTFIPDLGIGFISLKQLSQKTKQAKTNWHQYLSANKLLSLLAFISIILGLLITSKSSSFSFFLLSLVSLNFAFSSLRSPHLIYLQAQQKTKALAAFNALNALVPSLFSLVAILINPTLVNLFLSLSLGMLVSLISLVFYTRSVHRFSWHPLKKVVIKRLLHQSWPLGLAAFLGMVYAKADNLIIIAMLSTTALGYFGVTSLIVTGLITVFGNALATITFPVMAKKNLNKQLVLKISGLLFSLGLILTFLSFLLTPLIVKYLFGASYQPVINLVKLLSLVIPFTLLTRQLEQVIIIASKQKTYLKLNTIAVLINLFLNLTLIPIFNLNGAILARLISQLIITFIFIKKTRTLI